MSMSMLVLMSVFMPMSISMSMRRRGGGGERGGVGGWGCTQFAHGRSRLTIDPRIPIMPGWSTSGFHQPRRYCLHQARSAVRRLASRRKGELHPSKNRVEVGFLYLVPTFLLMEYSAN